MDLEDSGLNPINIKCLFISFSLTTPADIYEY